MKPLTPDEARVLTLLASALGHASALWPGRRVALVVGFTREDAGGFPDCSPAFVAAAERALALGSTMDVSVVAPWVHMHKADVLLQFEPDAAMVELLRSSWSCYRSALAPCGRCTACVVRARAFAARGIVDAPVAGVEFGGDVARDAGLRR